MRRALAIAVLAAALVLLFIAVTIPVGSWPPAVPF